MSNNKQLIRWEKHYSDGSVEYTDEESTSNFESNLNSVGGLIASRNYIQMKKVKWKERKGENLLTTDEMQQSEHLYCEDCGGNIDLLDVYCKHCGAVILYKKTL